MAEGFLHAYVGDHFNICSAGLEPQAEIHPYARTGTLEEGISLEGQYPKDSKEYLGQLSVRHLIVVCAHAQRHYPRIFLGARNKGYWPFYDPANATGTEEERLAKFRGVRDQIRKKIQEWLPTVISHQ
jgi:arsenate reductase